MINKTIAVSRPNMLVHVLQELVAVGPERVARLDLTTGQCTEAWSYDMMTSWSVNWTSEQVKVSTMQLTTALGNAQTGQWPPQVGRLHIFQEIL